MEFKCAVVAVSLMIDFRSGKYFQISSNFQTYYKNCKGEILIKIGIVLSDENLL